MRKFLLAVFLLAATISAFAQSRAYDSDHKYQFSSNWEIGVFGQYSNYHGNSSVGIGALATKRVGDYWRLRYEASMNSIKMVDGFDRYGTALAGFQFDYTKWGYLFADMGAVANPTMAQKFGLAANAGIGFATNFGKYSVLGIEGGSDLVQNGNGLDNTFFARVKYSVRTGITETDRHSLDIDHNMRATYGELKQENQLLKSENKKITETNEKAQAALDESLAMLQQLKDQLADCNTTKKVLIESQSSNGYFYPILFGFASAEISEQMDGVVRDIAEQMLQNNYDYRIEGYCSNNGTDWKNDVLSENRARAVYWRLIDYGVDENRLYPVGYGASALDKSTEQKVIIVQISK